MSVPECGVGVGCLYGGYCTHCNGRSLIGSIVGRYIIRPGEESEWIHAGGRLDGMLGTDGIVGHVGADLDVGSFRQRLSLYSTGGHQTWRR